MSGEVCLCLCNVSDNIQREHGSAWDCALASVGRFVCVNSCISTVSLCVYLHDKYCKWPVFYWMHWVISKHVVFVCVRVQRSYFIT